MLIFRRHADNSAARLWHVILFSAEISNEIAHSNEVSASLMAMPDGSSAGM
jgi:hypothetical protein